MDGTGSTTLSRGTEIYDNEFVGYGWYAIELTWHNAPIIEGNSMSFGGGTGIYLSNCFNDMKVNNNTIIQGSGKAIWINGCEGKALQKGSLL